MTSKYSTLLLTGFLGIASVLAPLVSSAAVCFKNNAETTLNICDGTSSPCQHDIKNGDTAKFQQVNRIFSIFYFDTSSYHLWKSVTIPQNGSTYLIEGTVGQMTGSIIDNNCLD